MKRAILNEYMEGVVKRGAEAVLPQHLEGRWLGLLLDEAQRFKDGEAGDCMGMLASVMVILSSQNNEALERVGEMEVESERLLECIGYYALWLSMEEMSRKIGIRGWSPTLENIFDGNRKINFWHEEF
jgi:hypothetical protein